MIDKDGIRWLNLIELESRRGDWIHSKNIYSIDRMMDKLNLAGPSEKTIALSVFNEDSPETIVIWVKAKLINGAWMFSILEEDDVLV
jgi:hypothetical protein